MPRVRLGGMEWLRNIGATLAAASGPRRFIVGSVVTVVAVALAWLKSRMMWAGAIPNWTVWVIVPLLLVLYWVLQYATRLRKEAEPRLRLEFEPGYPYEITEPFNANGQATRTFRVRVTNAGSTTLTDCIVYLQDFEDSQGQKGAFTPIALRTQHQAIRRSDKRGPFTLRAGQHKYVDVAILDEITLNSQICLCYAQDVAYSPFIRRDKYTLSLAAYGGPIPVKRQFTLDINSTGRLEMKVIK